MTVEAMAQMPCIVMAYDWGGSCHTFGVGVAVVNEDIHDLITCHGTRNVKVHAPATF
jgi:hypothetical protein